LARVVKSRFYGRDDSPHLCDAGRTEEPSFGRSVIPLF
jgi:hypothetical protein